MRRSSASSDLDAKVSPDSLRICFVNCSHIKNSCLYQWFSRQPAPDAVNMFVQILLGTPHFCGIVCQALTPIAQDSPLQCPARRRPGYLTQNCPHSPTPAGIGALVNEVVETFDESRRWK